MPSDCLSRLLLPTAIAAGEVRRGAGAAAEDDGAEDDGAAWRAPIGVGGGDASGVDVISAVGLGTTFALGFMREDLMGLRRRPATAACQNRIELRVSVAVTFVGNRQQW